jgi:hypothetical protein
MKPIKSLQWAAILFVAALLTQLTSAETPSAGRRSLPADPLPHAHVRREAAQPAATPGPTGYSPSQIRQAYGFDLLPSSIDGTGQTIAIVDAFGDRYATTTTTTGHGNHTTTTTTITDATQTDWNTFCNQFGLPTAGLTVVYPQGQGNVSTNWGLETTLDIQWAHAIAPGANILLVIATDNSYANLFAAVDYAVNAGANVVSMSWGGGESSTELSWDAHFNHPGVTFVTSSGDAGEVASGSQYPASSPYVVSVGGTELANINGIWSETAWSGSGGGISLYETMPGFQNGWQQFATGNMRSGPDVSYAGGPNSTVSVYCTPYGGWIKVYGTSAGAPQWAALVALANSASSSGTLGDANPILYSAASTSATPPYVNPDYFIDIASGSNGTDPDDFAISGYDFVTGLGSPMANNLVPALVSIMATPNFSLSVSPSSASVPILGSWTAIYAIAVNRQGGFSDGVNLSVSGLPEGAIPSFAPNPAGDSSTLSISVPTTAAPGSYPLTITGTDAGSTLADPSRMASAALVVSSGPTSVYVIQPSGSSGYSVSGGKNNSANLTVQILLRNNLGAPVAGASVSTTIYLNGAVYGSASATTLSDGTASFSARNAPAGTYTTVVTAVAASALNWDGKTPANSYRKAQ